MREKAGLEFVKLSPGWETALGALFNDLLNGGDDATFHPHPLTAEEAGVRCRYRGKDLYYVAADGRDVLAYGMLRGWDEGFEIPSLGIALSSRVRGTKLAQAFMMFLHAAARRRGAKRVRLKVHRQNVRAIKLYEQVGYRFESASEDELVGFIDLILTGAQTPNHIG
jgi:ribosomal-protein-alanine N-acetyltransferase